MANKRSKAEAKEYVLKMAREHDVKFVWLWFPDILGILKSFAITVEELEGALEEGMGFDGSSIEGFARIDESDMVALPDPDSYAYQLSAHCVCICGLHIDDKCIDRV